MTYLTGCSAVVCAMLVSSCAGVPRPQSPVPQPSGHAGLRAGFARIDITPPPGGGLFGYGPEGKKAVGYRMRLQARVMVLEDASGEKLAFVVTDLGANSVLVHRYASEATRDVGIGADRLILAATHTHAGPTHHFGLIHDVFASAGEKGFDWSWAMELSDRVAHAVQSAVAELRPARAAWINFPVWKVTHNRNLLPYRANQPRWRSPLDPPPTDATEAEAAIDPAWSMLRIDTRDADGVYRPAGALSIFAMHGTGAPSANDLYDADLHGMISQAIERAIDRLNGRPVSAVPQAFHLFAQGSEGDATAMPPDTRCPVPSLINPEAYGPKPVLSFDLVTEPERWEDPLPGLMERCVARSRAHMRVVAETVAQRVFSDFQQINQLHDDFSIRRVFTTIYPKNRPGEFCAQPRLGTATLAGPIDGTTRFLAAGVRYVEEGGSAIDPGPHKDALRACQGVKRFLQFEGVPLIQRLTQRQLYDLNLTPREAQVAVLRVGPQVLLALPAELTTTAGGRMKDAVADALGLDRVDVATLGVTNGYLNYVATADEYALQHYEGSSTLFGPNSAESFKNILVALARQLPSPGQPSPAPYIGKAQVVKGDVLLPHRFAKANDGPERVARCITQPWSFEGTIRFRFRDWYPGRYARAPYPLLQIETRTAGSAWRALTWDDDPQLEIRAVRADHARGYWWEARWTPDRPPAEWRVVLTSRGPNAAISSDDPNAACP